MGRRLTAAERSALRDVRVLCRVAIDLLNPNDGPVVQQAIKRARAGLVVLATLIDSDDEPTE
jgi:hypothetical protein